MPHKLRSKSAAVVQFKPESDAVLVIFDAIVPVVEVHDRLYNGKPDSGAAVSPGPGLVHLVELLPDMGQGLLGDGPAGVEDSDAGFAVCDVTADIDDLFRRRARLAARLHMVQGIAVIVLE